MNKLYLLILTFAYLALCGCASSTQNVASSHSPTAVVEDGNTKDARIVSQLVGTWTPDPKEKDFMDGTTTYHIDGTGTELMWPIGHPDHQIRIDFVWRVSDGMLTTRLVRANTPPSLHLPDKLVDRIVSITERDMVVELTEGYFDSSVKGQKKLKIRRA